MILLQCSHVNAEEASHPVQVVLISGHGDDLRYDGLLGPLCAKLYNREKRTKVSYEWKASRLIK